MSDWLPFPFLPVPGSSGILPLLPIALESHRHHIEAHGLVDSGATVNVLSHSVGLQLGFVWAEQSHALQLGSNLALQEARGVLVNATIAGFQPVRLAFAWSASDDVRIILGQTNFFLAFDVRFRRADMAFDLKIR